MQVLSRRVRREKTQDIVIHLRILERAFEGRGVKREVGDLAAAAAGLGTRESANQYMLQFKTVVHLESKFFPFPVHCYEQNTLVSEDLQEMLLSVVKRAFIEEGFDLRGESHPDDHVSVLEEGREEGLLEGGARVVPTNVEEQAVGLACAEEQRDAVGALHVADVEVEREVERDCAMTVPKAKRRCQELWNTVGMNE